MWILAFSYFMNVEPAVPRGFDLNDLLAGGTGATLMAALIFVGKLILDRTIPSRSDQRANVSLVLEGLSNMVKVLQEEKIADAKRLADKQVRIDALEAAAILDYESIAELRREILELNSRLEQKDRHIRLLVNELRKLGATVTGVEILESVESLEITLPTSEINQMQRPNGADIT